MSNGTCLFYEPGRYIIEGRHAKRFQISSADKYIYTGGET